MKNAVHVFCSLLYACSAASAAIHCSELKYGSESYERRMLELAKQANFANQDYTRHHEKFIAGYCAGDSKAAEAVVSQGNVSASDAAAIRRLVMLDVGAADASTLDALINGAFVAWSRSWFMDRYVNSSAKSAEQKFEGGTYLVRGTFKFTRGTALAEIPFSAALRKTGNSLAVAAVCYNDTTSGMTDCSNSGLNAQSRQVMGAIVALGILAALGGTSSDDVSTRPEPITTYRERRCTRETTCAPGYRNEFGWHAGECHTETRCDP